MRTSYKLSRLLLPVLTILLLLSSCTPGNETVKVLKILTKGNDIETTDPILVEVGNCNGFPDHKTKECTAGTENNVSINLGGTFGNGMLSFDPSVSGELGFSRSSAESIALDPPQDGFVYLYLVRITYQIITGEAFIQSPDGKQEVTQYRYQASCSISKSIPEIVSCPAVNQPTPLSTPVNTEDPSSTSVWPIVGKWSIEYRFGCTGNENRLTWDVRPDGTLLASSGDQGNWVNYGNHVEIQISTVSTVRYTGRINGDTIQGTMTGIDGCWSAQRIE